MRRPASRLPWSLLLLSAALVLALVQTWAVIDAERRHRALARGVLREQALAVAGRFLANVEVDFHFMIPEAFGPLFVATPGFDQLRGAPAEVAAPILRAGALRTRADGERALLPEIAESSREVARCTRPADDTLRYAFAYDRGARTVRTSVPVAASVLATIRDTVDRRLATTAAAEWYLASRFRRVGGGDRALVYVVTPDSAGHPGVAYGFETCNDAPWRWVFARAYARGVLPVPLIGGLPADSLLAVHAEATGAFAASYDSGPEPVGGTSATITSGQRNPDPRGAIRVRVTLHPRTADLLIVGGLPRNRLPVLLGTLALILGLMLFAWKQARREEALWRLRADFASSVSHELRTPLAQILLFAETVRAGRTRGPTQVERAVDVIIEEARRLQHLVENVLTFSRAERRTSLAAESAYALMPYLRDVVDRFRPLAARAGTALVVEGPERLDVEIPRDPLCQVVLNLLDNATKYGPAGQVVTLAVAARDGQVELSVTDQGPGVPAEERERIFDPFVRGRHGEGVATGGGIGLSVVRRIATELGGEAHVEPGPGRGARFVVRVPATRRAEPAT